MSDVPTTPTQPPAVVNNPAKNAMVLALFNKVKTKAEAAAAKPRREAKLNALFAKGEQFLTPGTSQTDPFNDPIDPLIGKNVYGPAHQQWSALLVKDRPSAQAVAASEEAIDTFRAALANKAIEFISQDVDSKLVIHETVRQAGFGGTAGIKVCIDAVEGKLTWTTQTVHDFLIDHTAKGDYRRARFVIFRGHISEDEGADLFEKFKIPGVPKCGTYTNMDGEECDGVEMFEYYQKPTRDFPRGFYASIIDSTVIELIDYPYVRKNEAGRDEYLLPFAMCVVRKQGESVYGVTPFTGARDMQRLFNEDISKLAKFKRATSTVHLKVPKQMPAFNPVASTTYEFTMSPDGIAAAAAMDFTHPPDPPAFLERDRDWAEKAVADVVGLNQQTLGNVANSTAGVTVEHVVELDQQKNSDVSQSIESMTEEVYKLSVAFVSLAYDEPRTARLIAGDTADVFDFRGSDFDGISVRMVPASEIDKLPAAKAAATATAESQGLATPLDLQKAQNSPGYGLSKRVATDAVEKFLVTGEVELQPGDVNADVLDEVIAKYKARALATRNMALWARMLEFERETADLAQRQATATPTPADIPAPGQAPALPPAEGAAA
jgi:hypothetical protein